MSDLDNKRPTKPSQGLVTGTERIRPSPCLALVIAWCIEPGRTGEVFLIPTDQFARMRPGTHSLNAPPLGERLSLGRGMHAPPDLLVRLRPERQRPVSLHLERESSQTAPEPLGADSLSADQAEITAVDSHTLRVTQRGKNRLVHNGKVVVIALVKPGDVLEVENTLILYCTHRNKHSPAWRGARAWPAFPFGGADTFGMVGESPRLWELREALMCAASNPNLHVLLHGPTGAGKEHAAGAIHRLTHRRGTQELVTHNAAIITESLADYQLFGIVENSLYKGLPPNEGVIGKARGSTLFLDEVARLPPSQQARLLRVLDPGGTYQPVGGRKEIVADIRCVAATNEPLETLREDFLARLGDPIVLPPLETRREDIPLLVEHCLVSWSENPAQDLGVFARRYIQGPADKRVFWIHPSLTTWLLRRPWPKNIRELLDILSRLVVSNQGKWLEPPDDAVLERPLTLPGMSDSNPTGTGKAQPVVPPPPEPSLVWTADETRVLNALLACGFVLEKCDWEAFGKEGNSSGTYIFRPLIWKALLHYQASPERVFSALCGVSLEVTNPKIRKKLLEHMRRAVKFAQDLVDDPLPSVTKNYSPEVLAGVYRLRAALQQGTLRLPDTWIKSLR